MLPALSTTVPTSVLLTPSGTAAVITGLSTPENPTSAQTSESQSGRHEPSGWAARNPNKAVQHPVKHKPITSAQKASRKLKGKQNQARAEEFHAEITKVHDYIDAQVKRLAEAYSKKPTAIRQLLTWTTAYKAARAPSVCNAIQHFRAVTIPDDLDETQKEIQEGLKTLAMQDPEDLDDTDREKLLKGLLAWRHLKLTGSRATHRAIIADTREFSNRVDADAQGFAARTGSYVIVLWGPSSVDDRVSAGYIATPGADQFCIDVLGKPLIDLARHLENWGCTRGEKNHEDREDLKSLQAECVKIIRTGLASIKKKKGKAMPAMNYVNYERKIMLAHKVQLVGWPLKKFCSPYDVHTVADVRYLRDALQNSTCYWKTIKGPALEELRKKLNAEETDGEDDSEGEEGVNPTAPETATSGSSTNNAVPALPETTQVNKTSTKTKSGAGKQAVTSKKKAGAANKEKKAQEAAAKKQAKVAVKEAKKKAAEAKKKAAAAEKGRKRKGKAGGARAKAAGKRVCSSEMVESDADDNGITNSNDSTMDVDSAQVNRPPFGELPVGPVNTGPTGDMVFDGLGQPEPTFAGSAPDITFDAGSTAWMGGPNILSYGGDLVMPNGSGDFEDMGMEDFLNMPLPFPENAPLNNFAGPSGGGGGVTNALFNSYMPSYDGGLGQFASEGGY